METNLTPFLDLAQPKLLLSGKRESGALPAQEHKTCHWGQIWRRRCGARLRRAAQEWRKAASGGAEAAHQCAGRVDIIWANQKFEPRVVNLANDD